MLYTPQRSRKNSKFTIANCSNNNIWIAVSSGTMYENTIFKAIIYSNHISVQTVTCMVVKSVMTYIHVPGQNHGCRFVLFFQINLYLTHLFSLLTFLWNVITFIKLTCDHGYVNVYRAEVNTIYIFNSYL